MGAAKKIAKFGHGSKTIAYGQTNEWKIWKPKPPKERLPAPIYAQLADRFANAIAKVAALLRPHSGVTAYNFPGNGRRTATARADGCQLAIIFDRIGKSWFEIIGFHFVSALIWLSVIPVTPSTAAMMHMRTPNSAG